jgi:myo-inositol-1(or 4)-monophosphatase
LLFSFRFSDHVCIGEESAAEGKHQPLTEKPTWIIDPIDGTMNFVHCFPCSAISLAFWVNKQAEFGIIYNPVEDKMYTARRGGGAFLNGDPIHVSATKELDKALLMFEVGSSRDPAKLRFAHLPC